MTYYKALKEAEKRREIAQMTHETSALEYLDAVVSSLRKSADNELISLCTGVDENGRKIIMEKEPERMDSLWGRILHFSSDVVGRMGIRMSNHVSRFFYGHSERYCESCFHRAEFIVHGFLCGLVLWGVFLMVLEFLVIHRG